MNLGIIALEKIATFTVSLPFSHFTSPWLSGSGLVLATVGLLLICLTKTHLRFVGMAIFLSAFLTIFFVKKPDVIFEQNQKFFAIYDENGLRFSKKLRPSKQRQKWIEQFKTKGSGTLREPDSILPCEKNLCEIEIKNKKILVLLERNKISEICKKSFDVIVNLTRKYQLPHCIGKEKIKIDNKDFYSKGTQFLFFEDEEFRSQKINRSSETKGDDESDFGDDAEVADGDF